VSPTLDDPKVAGCAVLGVPDPRLGQRVVAAVEPVEGESVGAEALLARCRTSLARYKISEQLLVVDNLPRNAMSKVIKRSLESLFAEDGSADG